MSISGHVTYANGTTPGKNVTMTLTAPSFTTQTTTTDVNGDYSFASVPGGNDYTVTPSKTGDNVNGLESFDAAFAARYVAALEVPTANQRIAADADDDGILTSFDAALIARSGGGTARFWDCRHLEVCAGQSHVPGFGRGSNRSELHGHPGR